MNLWFGLHVRLLLILRPAMSYHKSFDKKKYILEDYLSLINIYIVL